MKTREYLDDAEFLNDALDAIRARPRDKARVTFMKCLEVAYHQGRLDKATELEKMINGIS